jgi:hypothetical protein
VAEHTFEIPEEDRQAVVLAIAKLSLERPGWLEYLREIAGRLRGEAMFDDFRRVHADVAPSTATAWCPGPEGGADPISETARFAVADVVADLQKHYHLKWDWSKLDVEEKAAIMAKWRGLVAARFRRIGDA